MGEGFTKPHRWLVTVLAFMPAILCIFLAASKRWPVAQMFKAFCGIALWAAVLLAGVAAIGVVVLLAWLAILLWLMSGEAFRMLRFWPLSRMGLAKAGLLTAIRPLLVAIPVAVSVYFWPDGLMVALIAALFFVLGRFLWFDDSESRRLPKYLASRFCLPRGMFDRWLHVIGRKKGDYVFESEKSGYADWARRHIDEFLQGDME